MTIVRLAAIVSLGIVFGVVPVGAQKQNLSRYRQHTLGDSLAAVLKASGAREPDLKTVHERPSRIQELEWRAPYVSSGQAAADPVRTVSFSFVEDQLYRVVVTYERGRIAGLTDSDVIDSVSAAYDVIPMVERTGGVPPAGVFDDATVVARWDDGTSALTLVRGNYSREFRLVLVSKDLDARAHGAIAEAIRLDAHEAPQRELDQREKAAGEARESLEKARLVNKASFKP